MPYLWPLPIFMLSPRKARVISSGAFASIASKQMKISEKDELPWGSAVKPT